MSGVFQNIDPPPPPSPPGECVVYPPPLVRVEDTLAGWRGGWGEVNILEDARHSSVLYICKYFVAHLDEWGTVQDLMRDSLGSDSSTISGISAIHTRNSAIPERLPYFTCRKRG
jgi:hypothetical protein